MNKKIAKKQNAKKNKGKNENLKEQEVNKGRRRIMMKRKIVHRKDARGRMKEKGGECEDIISFWLRNYKKIMRNESRRQSKEERM